MKINLTIPGWVLLLLVCALPASAQFDRPYIEDFGQPEEVLLAAPDPSEGTLIIPVGTDLYDGNDVNTIYYGLTPPNSSNKPVLVFVHGYASSASVWFTGKDNMYNDVYQDGYRSAFVSLTPNRHMWTNGFMLARMIDVIAQNYGVNSVKVVGWSKGGVDTDAALVHFGANARVSEAFTLSTPHNGTSIAEVANSVLLSLVNIIFMQNNDATKSLTRGYMSYYRYLSDNAPGNTTPFTTFGAWGNGPLNRLVVPQGIIHLVDGSKSSGGNDGVVPYQSSRRPGGREIFSGQRKEYGFLGIPYYPGPSETELDHFEVTRGIVWPYVRGVFNGTLRQPAPNTPLDYNPNRSTSSQMQLVASAGGANTFRVATEEVQVFVLEDQSQPISVVDEQGEAFEMELIGEENGGKLYRLLSAHPGLYTVQSEAAFAAMVVETDGPAVELEMLYGENGCLFEANDEIRLRVQTSAANLDNAVVTGTLHRIHDLQFNAVDEAPVPVRFTQDGDAFIGEGGTHVPAGVYSVTINFRSPEFDRTLTATFTKLGGTAAVENEVELALGVAAYPNPFAESVRLTADFQGYNSAEVRIYDIFGKELRKFAVDSDTGVEELVWNARAEGAAAGLYIVELMVADGTSVTERIVLE